jgi:hypothetical protein
MKSVGVIGGACLILFTACQTTEVRTWDHGFPGGIDGMTRVGKEDAFRAYAVRKIDRESEGVLVRTVGGPRRIAYTMESFSPIFVTVSPRTADYLADAEDYHLCSRRASWVGTGGLVAIVFIPIFPPLSLVALPAAVGGYAGSHYFDLREDESYMRVREVYLEDLNRYIYAEELSRHHGVKNTGEDRSIPKT